MESQGHIELPAVEIRRDPAKRSFDILFSILALLITSPILGVIAFMIRLSSPGRVIYRKVVFGRGGKTIHMLKFRTMYQDAEDRLQQMLGREPAMLEEWQATQKLKIDPRITPIGLILRRLSLDELPQFWNVLKGDFSVVGPRPYFTDTKWYAGEQLQVFVESAPKILSVRPGITGIWATSGRATLTFKDRVDFDCAYVETLAFWQDLKLILKTIPAVVSSQGAY